MLQGQDFVKFMKVVLGIAPFMGQVINRELEERHRRGSPRPHRDAFPSHPSLSARCLSCRLAWAQCWPPRVHEPGVTVERDGWPGTHCWPRLSYCAYFVTVCFPHENTFLIKTEACSVFFFFLVYLSQLEYNLADIGSSLNTCGVNA